MKKSAIRRGSARTASLRASAALARMMSPAKRVVAKKASGKSAAKNTANKMDRKRLATKSAGGRTKVTQIPQSLEKAATQAGIFLYTNDSWSLRYFDPNDLHSLERKLFG